VEATDLLRFSTLCMATSMKECALARVLPTSTTVAFESGGVVRAVRWCVHACGLFYFVAGTNLPEIAPNTLARVAQRPRPPARQKCEDVDFLPPPSTMLTMNDRQTRESLTNKIQRMEAG